MALYMLSLPLPIRQERYDKLEMALSQALRHAPMPLGRVIAVLGWQLLRIRLIRVNGIWSRRQKHWAQPISDWCRDWRRRASAICSKQRAGGGSRPAEA